jgi:hypothetical protein
MSSRNAKQWMLGVASACILMSFSFTARAATNINLAVASNFFGVPPSNSAITDIINAFEIANHEDAITGVIEGHYALDRGRRENEVFDAMGVAAIDVDHSVTIEKCAGF